MRVKIHGRRRGTKPRDYKRGAVTEFSERSRNRLLFSAFNAGCDWFAFVTLTYPAEFPRSGREVKADFNRFMVALRREYPGVQYLAAMEFQKRGAPHFHMLVDRFIDLRWLSAAWYRAVGSGDEKHLQAGTQVQLVKEGCHGGAYMAKAYSAKSGFQKEVPADFQNVGRFWFGSRGLVVAVRRESFEDVRDSMPIIRALRQYAEKQVSKKKIEFHPVNQKTGEVRGRKVRRKRTLRHLHAGLQGFVSFKAAGIAGRLIGAAGGARGSP